ncbi:transposase [Rhizobium rhododendri]|uniref:transposase n=1 Tax=Rhizobium rhododendri TaxID=2506430 RepID=UPI00115F4559
MGGLYTPLGKLIRNASDLLDGPADQIVRVGQKNTITLRWAQRGTRPSAPHDQRTLSAYLLLIRRNLPKGQGASVVMPWCDRQAMNEHLLEISGEVNPGAQTVLILDQAGWHLLAKLIVPKKASPCSSCRRVPPELNPVENVWQFMRNNWLSNRVFTSYDDMVDHCCEA